MPPEFCTRLIRELYQLKSESHADTEDLNWADKKLDLCLFHEHPQQVNCRREQIDGAGRILA